MTPSTELYDLIHSLSKSEKRYFKLFASKHIIGDQNIYVELFDAIQEQKEYDESSIKDIFKGESFIKHLPSKKNYLYHIILDSLRVFHSQQSVEAKLRRLIHFAEILYTKRLYQQCHKTLSKAFKMAREEEEYDYIYPVISWEKKLLRTAPLSTKVKKSIEEFSETFHHTESLLHQMQELWQTSNTIFTIYQEKGHTISNDVLQEVEKLLSNITHHENDLMSYHAEYYYNQCHYLYHLIRVDANNMYPYILKMLQLLESNPKRIYNDITRYIATSNNHFLVLRRLQKFKELEQALQKTEKFVQNSRSSLSQTVKSEIELRLLNYRVSILIDTERLQEALTLVEENIKRITQLYKEPVTQAQLTTLSYKIAYIYFVNDSYNKSLDWLDKVINAHYAQERYDLQVAARLLSLFAHYELNNDLLLPYAINSTLQFLKSRKKLFKLEKELLTFLKDITKTNLDQDIDKKFLQFKKDLKTILNDPEEGKITYYLDIKKWLDKHI